MSPPASDPDGSPHSTPLYSEREMRGYRVLGFLAAAMVAGIGIVHRTVDPTAVDPVWERALVIVACLAGSAVAFVDRDRLFRVVLHGVVALVTLWVVHLLYLNRFAPEYAFSLLIVIAAGSSTFQSPERLLWYLGGTIAVVGAAAWIVEGALVSPVLYTTDVVGVSALLYVVLGSRMRVERDLARSEERFSLAARGSHDGLWDWDLASDRIYFSERWKVLLGREPGEIGDRPSEWFDRVHPDDRPALEREVERLREGVIQHLEHEYRMSHRSGEYRWMLTRGAAVRDAEGRALRIAGSQTDVTERRLIQQQLLEGTFRDTLTGLANRALFLDRLDRLFQRARRRTQYRFAILFVDLDRFKVVNDSLGHPVGDRLLREVAERLDECLRDEDTVARLGGDEFGVLMDGVEALDDAVRLAERIRDAVNEPVRLDGREISIGLSIGIALGDHSYTRSEDILRDADIAMYRAKGRRSGSRYEIFDERMHREAVLMLDLEHGLRRALEDEEFELQYQPVVDLFTEELRGFEALVRWRHPESGLLLPDAFLPRAEETGLILPLGEWVLRTACSEMGSALVEHEPSGDTFLSVNLSASQFLRADLLDRVDSALADSGLPARRLRLEVTEAILLGDPPTVEASLRGLRKRGVGVSVDDFGTGHSSLAFLHRFPIHALKMDRSFLDDLGRDGRGGRGRSALARTVLGMARTLGLECVAEGVERPDQLHELLEMDCPMGQGFFFSEPLDPERARELLEEGDRPWRGRGRRPRLAAE